MNMALPLLTLEAFVLDMEAEVETPEIALEAALDLVRASFTEIYLTQRTGGPREQYSDGYSRREELPLPDKPPYTAHIGNLAFEVTEGEIMDFFKECAISNVRIVMDRMEGKPKGFGYAEYSTLDGLKKALDMSGSQFMGRNIRVSVAEPRKCIYELTKSNNCSQGTSR